MAVCRMRMRITMLRTRMRMSEAFDAVLWGKKRKTCRQGQYLLKHRDEVIAELTAKLKDG